MKLYYFFMEISNYHVGSGSFLYTLFITVCLALLYADISYYCYVGGGGEVYSYISSLSRITIAHASLARRGGLYMRKTRHEVG